MVVIHLQRYLTFESSESSTVESDRSDSSHNSHNSNIQISCNDIEIAISELMETYLAFYGCLISTFYSYVYPLDTSIRRKIKRTRESIGYFYRHVMIRKNEYSNYILEYMKNHGDIYLYAMYNKLYAVPESSMFSSNHDVYIVFASPNYGVSQTNYEISGIVGENDYTEPSLIIQINSDDLILSERSEKSETSKRFNLDSFNSFNSFKEKFEKSLNKYCKKTSDFFHDAYYATSLIPDDMLTTLEDYCERFKVIVMTKYDEIFTKIQLFASTHKHFQLLFAVFKIIVLDETDKRTDENLKSEDKDKNSELLFELYPKAEEPSSDDDSEDEEEEEDEAEEEDLKSEDKDEN